VGNTGWFLMSSASLVCPHSVPTTSLE